VLNPQLSSAPNTYIYAQCLKGKPGGVTLLVVNADRNAAQELTVSTPSERYTMTENNLQSTRVDLNGSELKLGVNDALPQLAGAPAHAGKIAFAPASITFLAIPTANNASC